MAEYLLIKSYTDMENRGMRFVSSAINTVIEAGRKSPPYVVAGYSQGWTFSPSEITFTPNLKRYAVVFPDEIENFEITAVNDDVAFMLAENKFNPPFELVEITTTYREVKRK